VQPVELATNATNPVFLHLQTLQFYWKLCTGQFTHGHAPGLDYLTLGNNQTPPTTSASLNHKAGTIGACGILNGQVMCSASSRHLPSPHRIKDDRTHPA